MQANGNMNEAKEGENKKKNGKERAKKRNTDELATFSVLLLCEKNSISIDSSENHKIRLIMCDWPWIFYTFVVYSVEHRK